MSCAFCENSAGALYWVERSHRGKVLICTKCIAQNDQRQMQTRGAIVLQKVGERLENRVGSLNFQIKEAVRKGSEMHFFFLVGRKRWEGTMFESHPESVYCSRRKHDLKIE